MKPIITIVIPLRSAIKEIKNSITGKITREARKEDSPEITLASLNNQSFKGFTVILSRDEGNGANYARNKGFKKVDTEYVLFCDNDIEWTDTGILDLYYTLEKTPKASYCYGGYEMDGLIQCMKEFNAEDLKRNNYISTMSLIRTKDFPGFDEELERFQDWDLWLNMLSKGKIGISCEKIVFKTTRGNGITYGGKIDTMESYNKVRNKWIKNGLIKN